MQGFCEVSTFEIPLIVVRTTQKASEATGTSLFKKALQFVDHVYKKRYLDWTGF